MSQEPAAWTASPEELRAEYHRVLDRLLDHYQAEPGALERMWFGGAGSFLRGALYANTKDEQDLLPHERVWLEVGIRGRAEQALMQIAEPFAKEMLADARVQATLPPELRPD